MTTTPSLDLKTKLQVTCQNCSLTSLCIPRGLAQKDIERISRIVSRKKTLQRGEHLFHEGDKFRGVLAIKGGTAKTVIHDSYGGEYITGFLLPGELLGFDALATNHHKCSAVALETLSYCELPADQLDQLCHEVPNLLRELFRHASAKLDEETDQVIINKRAAEERVAMFILNLSDRLRKRGFSPIDFKLTLTRQEIGNFLGLALETVSRTLRNLEDAGLITVHHRDVRILDLDALRATYANR
ncbi:helix-turn-helix domain-containing protein [Methylocaldum sp.]|uniref:helix-turn-helix domain-containing protein n=1 Tax=Methylocaldum sp. TaxID=1969727 RepID=UPI002D4AD05B|nr:helix-turn-helix domain-containing protein [Methylocaldum sp.]HYE33846.1 helix-turn-helix domain-containing protein [Methylocaldum sp.]